MLRLLTIIITLSIVVPAAAADYRELKWADLIPEGEKELLKDKPPVDHSQIFNPSSRSNQFYGVVGDLKGKEVRIPGFMVPVELNGDNEVIDFFLVPYFGACIHVPPPPPNQIVFARSSKPLEMKSIYDAVWLYGTIDTEVITNEIASAAYVVAVDKIELYQ